MMNYASLSLAIDVLELYSGFSFIKESFRTLFFSAHALGLEDNLLAAHRAL